MVAGSFSMMGWLTFCLKIMDSPRSRRSELAEVVHVLHGDGLVEPQLLLLLVDHFLRRMAAQHGAHGVSRA